MRALPPPAQRRVWAGANAAGPATLSKVKALAERARAALPTPALEEVRARSEARAKAAGDVTVSDDEKGLAMDRRMVKHLARAERLARRRVRLKLAQKIAAVLAAARSEVGPAAAP
jgi:hypothetical protein